MPLQIENWLRQGGHQQDGSCADCSLHSSMKIPTLAKHWALLPFLLCICCLPASGQTAEQFHQEAIHQGELGNHEAALKAINHAIQVDSFNSEYLNLKAFHLNQLNLVQEAFDTYNKAITLSPNSPNLFNNRGALLLRVGEVDAAINDYDQAIRLAGSDSMKFHYIGARGMAKGFKMDYQGGLDDLTRAYEYYPKDLTILLNLSTIMGRLGKPEEALTYLFISDKIKPNDIGTLGNIGFQYQKMKLYEKSNEYYNAILRLDSSQALGYSNRAFNNLQLGKLNEAMSDADMAIKLYPANSWAYRNRALIHIKEDDIDSACNDLEMASQLGFDKMYGDEVRELKVRHCKNR